jgi:hypothetical protein
VLCNITAVAELFKVQHNSNGSTGLRAPLTTAFQLSRDLHSKVQQLSSLSIEYVDTTSRARPVSLCIADVIGLLAPNATAAVAMALQLQDAADSILMSQFDERIKAVALPEIVITSLMAR